MSILPARVRRRRPDADDWQRTDGGVWLPRAPLRGGMVRRGMGFGFEPAGCCCVAGVECSKCSSLRSAYDITLTGLTDITDCRDTTYMAFYVWNSTTTGIGACNDTWRVTFSGEDIEQTHSSGCGKFGGCRWESAVRTNVFHYYVTNQLGEVQVNGYVNAYVTLYITANAGGGIDAMVVLVFSTLNTNVCYTKTEIACGAGALDGLVLPYCNSWFPQCDFGSGGDATIAAA